MSVDRGKVIATAQKHVAKGNFDRAIVEYRKLVADNPKDVRTWLKIGDLHTRKGSRGEAVETYLRVAGFYASEGFYLKAVAVYKQVLKLDPSRTAVLLDLAEMYERLQLVSDALATYEQVAGAKARANDISGAADTLAKMANLDPDNVPVRIRFAETLSRAGRKDEAAAEFRAGAQLLKSQGRTDDYVKVAERLLFHAPDDVGLSRELARMYLDKQDAKRALTKLQVCFKREPRDVSTLEMLAEAFGILNQSPKKISVFREIVRIHEDAARPEQSAKVLKQILELDPNDAEARRILAKYAPRKEAKPAPKKPAPSERPSEPLGLPTSLERPSDPISLPEPVSRASEPVGLPEPLSEIPLVGDEDASLSIDVDVEDMSIDASDVLDDDVMVVDDLDDEEFIDADADVMLVEEDDFSLVSSAAYNSIEENVSKASALVDDEDDDEPILFVESELPPSRSVPVSSAAPPAPASEEPSIPPDVAREATIARLLTECDVFHRYGLRDKVISQLEEVTRIAPDHVEAHERLKDAYMDAGRRQDAVRTLHRLAAIFSEDRPQLGQLYRRQILDLDPDDAQARAAFGIDDGDDGDAQNETTQMVDVAEIARRMSEIADQPPEPGAYRLSSAEAALSEVEMDLPEMIPSLAPPAMPAKSTEGTPRPEVVQQEIDDFVDSLPPPAITPVSTSSAPASTPSAPISAAEMIASSEFLLDELSTDDAQAVSEDSVPEPVEPARDEMSFADVKTALVSFPPPAPDPDDFGESTDAAIDVAAIEADALRSAEEAARIAESIAPGAVAAEAVAAEAVAPEDVAPEAVAPEAVAPEPVAPAAIAPEPATVAEDAAPVTPVEATSVAEVPRDTTEVGVVEQDSLEVSLDARPEESREELTQLSDLPASFANLLAASDPSPPLDPPFTDESTASAAAIDVSREEPASAPPAEPSDRSSTDMLMSVDDLVLTPEEFASSHSDEEEARAREAAERRISRPPTEIEEALEEVDFFMAQGLWSEARATLDEAQKTFADHPLLREKLGELDEMSAAAPPPSHVSLPAAEDPAFALAERLAEDFGHADAPGADVLDVEDVFAQFKKGVEEQIGLEDSDTHFDLGIAYKEMGLIDDAIHEFEVAMVNPQRECIAHMMIGLCHTERGEISEGIGHFKKGLYAENKSEREELGLYFELGAAYQALGDQEEALYYFQKVQKRDDTFRDVVRHIAALRAGGSVALPTPQNDLSRAFEDIAGGED